MSAGAANTAGSAQLELRLVAPSARRREGRAPAAEYRAGLAGALLARLRAAGLRRIESCRLTRNRTVVVCGAAAELRVHEGSSGRRRMSSRRSSNSSRPGAAARTPCPTRHRVVSRAAGDAPVRRERPHPDDVVLVARLTSSTARSTPSTSMARWRRWQSGSHGACGDASATIARAVPATRRRSCSAAGTSGATAGAPPPRRCSTRWCTSGRRRPGARWVTAPSFRRTGAGGRHRAGGRPAAWRSPFRSAATGAEFQSCDASRVSWWRPPAWPAASGLARSGAGPLPPLGGLLDPASGAWAAARFAELPRQAIGRIPHLAGPVDVRYDRRGVPHIFATTEADALRALGYVVARDRLFQLDLQTHAAAGRLTEWVGARALAVDREMRNLGLPRAAEHRMARLAPDAPERLMLDAFADGVNAWIDGLDRAAWPIEYKLLGVTPGAVAARQLALPAQPHGVDAGRLGRRAPATGGGRPRGTCRRRRRLPGERPHPGADPA